MRQRIHNHSGWLGRLTRLLGNSRDRDLLFIVLVSYFLSLSVVMTFMQWRTLFLRIRLSDYETGRVAENDLVVDRDIQFIDTRATDLKREATARLALPVYTEHVEIRARILDRFAVWSDVYLKKRAEKAGEEKLFLELQSVLPGVFNREGFSSIASYRYPERLVETTEKVLNRILEQGYVSITETADGDLPVENIVLLRWSKGRQWKDQVRIEDVITRKNLQLFIRNLLEVEGASSEQIRTIGLVVESVAEETVFFNPEQTEQGRLLAREEAQPVLKKLLKGERIIRKGFLITADDYLEIEALSKYSTTVNTNAIIGNALFLVLLFLLSFILLSPPLVARRISKVNLYLLLGLFLFYLVYAVAVLKTVNLPEWIPVSTVFPTALIAMMALVFINMQASVTLVTIASLALLIFTRMDAIATLFAIISGIAGAVVIRDAEKRIDLIKAGTVLGLLNIGFILVLGLFKNFQPGNFLVAGVWSFLNGFMSGIFLLGFLPIFEHALNAPTRFRLLELSDLNSPVLKRMLMLAPGTYNHSVTVANLAESASREIGANALLARVGSYYHDIGKVDQAEYFIENQTAYNKHDELKPSLSAAVIKSHVKIGVEKAKEIFLPKEVIDIISQHHGKGLITYFYQRAVEKDGVEQVSADDFSYTESPPSSKEAAVVMLADSVEAAARTLKRPTVAKLEKFVWAIIMEKFNAEQLNESDLTFKNLETIKRTFVQILAGHFHSRIEYPKVKENQR